MDKATIAQYLVNLHTLMQAQSSGAHSMTSATLAAEYEKHWSLLKEAINKENENETRKR